MPFWSIAQVLLSQQINNSAQLVDMLDTIAITLRKSSLPNNDVLQERLASLPSDFFSDVWPTLATLALDLPSLFPGGRLPILS